VYEAEIRRLRSENEFLKLQNNSLVVHLNEALAKLDKQHAPFNATQKGFWLLTRSGRNKKKRKIKSLVLESIKGIEEFVPKEVCFFLPISLSRRYSYCGEHCGLRYSPNRIFLAVFR